jgi:Sulfatase-modifying factor enzyme 1/SIR2-like domain
MSFVDQALRILGPIGNNERHLRDLKDELTNLVPFVGAGLSIPLNYPSWSELLISIAPDDKIREEVRILLKHFNYEEAAQEVFDGLTPTNFRAKLVDAFNESKLPPSIGGAISILPALTSGLVITTNLDRAIERSFAQAGAAFSSVLRGGDLYDGSAAIQSRRHVLLKLHGDYEDQQPVLTLSQYEQAYGSAEVSNLPVPTLLQHALVSGTVLFLGCSLQFDRTVQVIEHFIRRLGVEHFALLSAKENNGKRVQQLRAWRIKPIFFPADEWGTIESFLKCISRTREELLAPAAPRSMSPDARRRFERLLQGLHEWKGEGDRTVLLGVLREHEIWDHIDSSGAPAAAAVRFLDLSAKYGTEPFCLLLRNLRGNGETRQELRREISDLESALRTKPQRLGVEWKDGSPYRGLAYFDRRHAPIFFGRELEVNKLIQILTTTEQGRRFTVVVGASGSGKSSLVRAGLWARVHNGQIPELPGSERWLVTAMTPLAMGDPAASLQAALNRSLEEHDGFEDKYGLQIEQTPLAELAERILPKGNTRWLLILDQMEELFTLGTKGVGFLDRLLESTRPDSSSRFQVVATLRSDFFHFCLDPQHQPLKRAVSRDGGQFLLSDPGRLALERMVSGPINEVNLPGSWIIDHELPLTIAADTERHPGGLALMSFALRELYDLCAHSSHLDLTTYHGKDFGGLSGCIARRADATLAQIGENAEAVLERVFGRLVRVNHDDAPIHRRERRSAWHNDPESLDLVDAFVKARLLVADRESANVENPVDPVIEIAHDALLREWPKLARWIGQTREAFRLAERVRTEAHAWMDGDPRRHHRRPWPADLVEEYREKLRHSGLLDQLLDDPAVARLLTPELEWMSGELRDEMTTHLRRRDIGLRLNEIGDPRPGVGVVEAIPDITWRPVPTGEIEVTNQGHFLVKSFRMAAFPITFGQFRAFLDAEDGFEIENWWYDMKPAKRNSYWTNSRANHPLTNVSWYEAAAFCRWLSAKLRYDVRLPDEQEWQWAAQSGRPAYSYPWGPTWRESLANTRESDINGSTAVGMYPSGNSSQMISDLSGSVWEWCRNEHRNLRSVNGNRDESRTLRGGSWFGDRLFARAQFRDFHVSPAYRSNDLGFRVVCENVQDNKVTLGSDK